MSLDTCLWSVVSYNVFIFICQKIQIILCFPVPWLIAYTVMQLILGIPMFLMEYFIGQFSSSSIISMYSVTPALKGKFYSCMNLVTNSQFSSSSIISMYSVRAKKKTYWVLKRVKQEHGDYKVSNTAMQIRHKC